MKFRKLKSLFLCTALVTVSLFGCGTDDTDNSGDKESDSSKSAKTFGESLEMGSAIKAYSYATNISLSMSGDAFFEDMDIESMAMLGLTGDKMEASVDLTGNVDGKGNSDFNIGFSFGQMNSDLLDGVYKDNTLYLNVKKVMTEISSLVGSITGEDISTEMSALMPENDYAKITEDMMNTYMDEAMSMAGEEITTDIPVPDEAAVSDLMTYLADKIFEAVDLNAKSAITEKDGVFTITVNNDNINDIIKGISAVLSKDGAEIYTKITGVFGDIGMTSDEFVSMGALLETYDVTTMMGEDVTFEVKVSTGNSDGKWNLGLSASVEAEGSKMEVSMTNSITEKSDVEIAVPESVISDEELQSLISLLESSAMDDSDYDLDGYDLDDYDLDDFDIEY